jgi:hypothetical protein
MMSFVRLGFVGVFLLFSGSSFAQSCLNLLSPGAKAIGDIALCRMNHNGTLADFACQRYWDGDHLYAVLFDGGEVPKAIYASALGGTGTVRLLWSQEESAQRISCTLARPSGVPAQARFLGAASCEDDNGRHVPCSLYHNEAARDAKISRHMVFFDPKGKGPVDKLVFSMGRNHRAMTAELAFQLGKAKLASGCCHDQALAYLRFAYESFPQSPVYQRAYFSSSSAARADNGEYVVR